MTVSRAALDESVLSGTAAAWRWPRRCRLLRTPPASGSWNMACDSHLMAQARASGEMILRAYAWSQPTISFGRHERVLGRYNAITLAEREVGAVRRPTGGRALLHHREVTYSVALPLDDHVRWPAAYDAINRMLLRAIQSLGVAATLVDQSQGHSLPPEGPPCFAAPSVGEIAVGDAKLIGSAVWRERGAYLQHGSILLHDDQPLLLSLMIDDALASESRSQLLPAAALSSLLGHEIAWETVVQSLENAASEKLPTSAWQLTPDDHSAVTLAQRHYEDPDWLWRR